jgi:hypothetical protein
MESNQNIFVNFVVKDREWKQANTGKTVDDM